MHPSVPPLCPALSPLTSLRDTMSHPACDQGLCHPSGSSGSSTHPQTGKNPSTRLHRGCGGRARGNQATDDNSQRLPWPTVPASCVTCTHVLYGTPHRLAPACSSPGNGAGSLHHSFCTATELHLCSCCRAPWTDPRGPNPMDRSPGINQKPRLWGPGFQPGSGAGVLCRRPIPFVKAQQPGTLPHPRMLVGPRYPGQ